MIDHKGTRSSAHIQAYLIVSQRVWEDKSLSRCCLLCFWWHRRELWCLICSFLSWRRNYLFRVHFSLFKP